MTRTIQSPVDIYKTIKFFWFLLQIKPQFTFSFSLSGRSERTAVVSWAWDIYLILLFSVKSVFICHLNVFIFMSNYKSGLVYSSWVNNWNWISLFPLPGDFLVSMWPANQTWIETKWNIISLTHSWVFVTLLFVSRCLFAIAIGLRKPKLTWALNGMVICLIGYCWM